MSGDTTAKYTSDWVELGPNDLPQEIFILGTSQDFMQGRGSRSALFW
jgi:hypothetical protein